MNNTVGISMSSFQKIFAYDEKETNHLFDVQVNDFPSVSVIIPTLNEAKNLRYVLPYIPTWIHEVIIVDGRSTDDTIDVALSMHPKVRIVEETRRGKGAALKAGFSAAEGEIIIMLDADGSMSPLEF